jgi:hypothetical protein
VRPIFLRVDAVHPAELILADIADLIFAAVAAEFDLIEIRVGAGFDQFVRKSRRDGVQRIAGTGNDKEVDIFPRRVGFEVVVSGEAPAAAGAARPRGEDQREQFLIRRRVGQRGHQSFIDQILDQIGGVGVGEIRRRRKS